MDSEGYSESHPQKDDEWRPIRAYPHPPNPNGPHLAAEHRINMASHQQIHQLNSQLQTTRLVGNRLMPSHPRKKTTTPYPIQSPQTANSAQQPPQLPILPVEQSILCIPSPLHELIEIISRLQKAYFDSLRNFLEDQLTTPFKLDGVWPIVGAALSLSPIEAYTLFEQTLEWIKKNSPDSSILYAVQVEQVGGRMKMNPSFLIPFPYFRSKFLKQLRILPEKDIQAFVVTGNQEEDKKNWQYIVDSRKIIQMIVLGNQKKYLNQSNNPLPKGPHSLTDFQTINESQSLLNLVPILQHRSEPQISKRQRSHLYDRMETEIGRTPFGTKSILPETVNRGSKRITNLRKDTGKDKKTLQQGAFIDTSPLFKDQSRLIRTKRPDEHISEALSESDPILRLNDYSLSGLSPLSTIFLGKPLFTTCMSQPDCLRNRLVSIQQDETQVFNWPTVTSSLQTKKQSLRQFNRKKTKSLRIDFKRETDEESVTKDSSAFMVSPPFNVNLQEPNLTGEDYLLPYLGLNFHSAAYSTANIANASEQQYSRTVTLSRTKRACKKTKQTIIPTKSQNQVRTSSSPKKKTRKKKDKDEQYELAQRYATQIQVVRQSSRNKAPNFNSPPRKEETMESLGQKLSPCALTPSPPSYVQIQPDQMTASRNCIRSARQIRRPQINQMLPRLVQFTKRIEQHRNRIQNSKKWQLYQANIKKAVQAVQIRYQNQIEEEQEDSDELLAPINNSQPLPKNNADRIPETKPNQEIHPLRDMEDEMHEINNDIQGLVTGGYQGESSKIDSDDQDFRKLKRKMPNRMQEMNLMEYNPKRRVKLYPNSMSSDQSNENCNQQRSLDSISDEQIVQQQVPAPKYLGRRIEAIKQPETFSMSEWAACQVHDVRSLCLSDTMLQPTLDLHQFVRRYKDHLGFLNEKERSLQLHQLVKESLTVSHRQLRLIAKQLVFTGQCSPVTDTYYMVPITQYVFSQNVFDTLSQIVNLFLSPSIKQDLERLERHRDFFRNTMTYLVDYQTKIKQLVETGLTRALDCIVTEVMRADGKRPGYPGQTSQSSSISKSRVHCVDPEFTFKLRLPPSQRLVLLLTAQLPFIKLIAPFLSVKVATQNLTHYISIILKQDCTWKYENFKQLLINLIDLTDCREDLLPTIISLLKQMIDKYGKQVDTEWACWVIQRLVSSFLQGCRSYWNPALIINKLILQTKMHLFSERHPTAPILTSRIYLTALQTIHDFGRLKEETIFHQQILPFIRASCLKLIKQAEDSAQLGPIATDLLTSIYSQQLKQNLDNQDRKYSICMDSDEISEQPINESGVLLAEIFDIFCEKYILAQLLLKNSSKLHVNLLKNKLDIHRKVILKIIIAFMPHDPLEPNNTTSEPSKKYPSGDAYLNDQQNSRRCEDFYGGANQALNNEEIGISANILGPNRSASMQSPVLLSLDHYYFALQFFIKKLMVSSNFSRLLSSDPSGEINKEFSAHFYGFLHRAPHLYQNLFLNCQDEKDDQQMMGQMIRKEQAKSQLYQVCLRLVDRCWRERIESIQLTPEAVKERKSLLRFRWICQIMKSIWQLGHPSAKDSKDLKVLAQKTLLLPDLLDIALPKSHDFSHQLLHFRLEYLTELYDWFGGAQAFPKGAPPHPINQAKSVLLLLINAQCHNCCFLEGNVFPVEKTLKKLYFKLRAFLARVPVENAKEKWVSVLKCVVDGFRSQETKKKELVIEKHMLIDLTIPQLNSQQSIVELSRKVSSEQTQPFDVVVKKITAKIIKPQNINSRMFMSNQTPHLVRTVHLLLQNAKAVSNELLASLQLLLTNLLNDKNDGWVKTQATLSLMCLVSVLCQSPWEQERNKFATIFNTIQITYQQLPLTKHSLKIVFYFLQTCSLSSENEAHRSAFIKFLQLKASSSVSLMNLHVLCDQCIEESSFCTATVFACLRQVLIETLNNKLFDAFTRETARSTLCRPIFETLFCQYLSTIEAHDAKSKINLDEQISVCLGGPNSDLGLMEALLKYRWEEYLMTQPRRLESLPHLTRFCEKIVQSCKEQIQKNPKVQFWFEEIGKDISSEMKYQNFMSQLSREIDDVDSA